MARSTLAKIDHAASARFYSVMVAEAANEIRPMAGLVVFWQISY